MIVDLPNTTTSKISKALVRIREEGGAVALGRVLTLIISSTLGHEEEAIAAANDASREHPMRVIVVSTQVPNAGDPEAVARVDAEIRVGGDAGASEVIVLRVYGQAANDPESLVTGLLLSDAPVVTWWPGEAPEIPSETPLGRLANRRITDASAQLSPQDALFHLCHSYRPGDTDFAWTRLTLWRGQLAAVLDQPPYEAVTAVQVTGAAASPSTTSSPAFAAPTPTISTMSTSTSCSRSLAQRSSVVRASATTSVRSSISRKSARPASAVERTTSPKCGPSGSTT